MFPISDDNPGLRTPVMTIAILVVTWGVWLLIQGGGSAYPLAVSVCDLGMVPGELTRMAPLGYEVPLGVINGQGMACRVDNEPINWATPVLSDSPCAPTLAGARLQVSNARATAHERETIFTSFLLPGRLPAPDPSVHLTWPTGGVAADLYVTCQCLFDTRCAQEVPTPYA